MPEYMLRTAEGSETPTMEFDAERVHRVIERIARGLYFHKFERIWACRLRVISDGFLMPDLSESPYSALVRRLR